MCCTRVLAPVCPCWYLPSTGVICRSTNGICLLQNWSGTGYGGLVYDAPEEIRDYSVKGKWRIPVNMHIGNMGLAPAIGAPIITAPPMRTGGNIDNKRIGIGGASFSYYCLVSLGYVFLALFSS